MVMPLRLALARLREQVATIEQATPLQKLRAATDALRAADALLTDMVERIEQLEKNLDE